MKKKINVVIHKAGSDSDKFVRLIGRYNEGHSDLSVPDIEGFINTYNVMWHPVSSLKIVKDETEPNTYHISEDGGNTFTMSLEFVEIFELEPQTN